MHAGHKFGIHVCGLIKVFCCHFYFRVLLLVVILVVGWVPWVLILHFIIGIIAT
jgi:hypothetical protein